MNKRLARHEERKKALVKQSSDILDAVDAEDRDPSEDEQARLDENKAELDGLAKKIEYEQQLSPHISQPVIDPIGADFARPEQITAPRPAWEEDENRGFKSTQEFFLSVMEATERGATSDERLQFLSGRRNNFQITAGSDEAGTYADPYGGFLVPSGFMPKLLQVGSDGDPTAGRTTQIPMPVPSVSIPARTDKDHTSSVSGGLIVYRRSETQTVTAARMQLEQIKLEAHPLMGLSYATEELISDAAISFVALLEAGFRDEFASKILYEKIHGTGVGEMEGVLTSPAKIEVTAETNQDADSIVYENIVNMYARCWRPSQAIWLYNNDCLPQLMTMIQVIGTSGVPMWQSSAREGEPNRLLGMPAFANEYAATIGDNGDIMLVNWSQYLEGTYKPLQQAESMHVRFANNERTFRFTMRIDGRNWWRSALTPKKSATTLSPIVTLAARA